MSGSINQLFSLAPWQSAAAQPNALNYAGGDMGLTDISQWLPYQTYAQFLPQQQQQMLTQPQGQQTPTPQQPQAPGQPQQLTTDQQAQQMAILMQIAGVGRPNYGGAGPGGDQGAAGQGY